jgi:hypothetical protein
VSERRDQHEQRAGEQDGEDYDTQRVLTRNCGCRQDHLAYARPWSEAEQRPPAPGAREDQSGDGPISDSRRRVSLPPSFTESVCLAAASARKQRPDTPARQHCGLAARRKKGRHCGPGSCPMHRHRSALPGVDDWRVARHASARRGMKLASRFTHQRPPRWPTGSASGLLLRAAGRIKRERQPHDPVGDGAGAWAEPPPPSQILGLAARQAAGGLAADDARLGCWTWQLAAIPATQRPYLFIDVVVVGSASWLDLRGGPAEPQAPRGGGAPANTACRSQVREVLQHSVTGSRSASRGRLSAPLPAPKLQARQQRAGTRVSRQDGSLLGYFLQLHTPCIADAAGGAMGRRHGGSILYRPPRRAPRLL